MCARTTVTTLGEPSLIAKNAGRAVRLFGTELLTVRIDLDGLTSRTLAAAIRQTGSVLSWTQSPDGIVDVNRRVLTSLRRLFARHSKGKRKLVLRGFCNNYPKFATRQSAAGTMRLLGPVSIRLHHPVT